MRPAPPPWPMVVAVAAGGATGALLRWLLGLAFPDGSGFPWTTLTINLVGSGLLALLPALSAVRRSPLAAVGLGTGVLGGFTTLSTYSEQTRALLTDGRPLLAAAYYLGTLVGCLVVVAAVHRLSSPLEQRAFELEEGNE